MIDYLRADTTRYLLGLLIMAAWQACILTVVATAICLTTRSVLVRAKIWSATLVALLVCPLLGLLLPHCYLFYTGGFEPLHFPTNLVPAHMGQEAAPLYLSSWPDLMCRILLGAWITGIVVVAVRLIVGYADMRRLLNYCRPVRDRRLQALLARICDGPAPELLELDGLVGAFSWQIHRPAIVLPADRGQLSEQELEMILRHELAHLRAGDPLGVFIQRCLEAFYWFHPAVWWACGQAAKYREFHCDVAVLQAGCDSRRYAACIGRLALWTQVNLPMLPAGVGLLWTQHVTLQRVRGIVAGRISAERVRGLRQRLALALLAAAALGVSLLRVDLDHVGAAGQSRWTAWPSYTAHALDLVGVTVRDFPLDAHRYDPAGDSGDVAYR